MAMGRAWEEEKKTKPYIRRQGFGSCHSDIREKLIIYKFGDGISTR